MHSPTVAETRISQPDRSAYRTISTGTQRFPTRSDHFADTRFPQGRHRFVPAIVDQLGTVRVGVDQHGDSQLPQQAEVLPVREENSAGVIFFRIDLDQQPSGGDPLRNTPLLSPCTSLGR